MTDFVDIFGLYRVSKFAAHLVTQTGDASYDLTGVLQYSNTLDSIVLAVPAALSAGLYAALDVPGANKPPDRSGSSITVLTPEELATVGGPDKINERGKRFTFSTGRSLHANSEEPNVSDIWYLRIFSPALQALRKSYGLEPLPPGGFYLLIGLRYRGVLANNGVSKLEQARSQSQELPALDA